MDICQHGSLIKNCREIECHQKWSKDMLFWWSKRNEFVFNKKKGV